MIIEPIGCSGAGKTTMCRMLGDNKYEGDHVVRMSDLPRNKLGLHHVNHPTATNVIQDFTGLPFFARSWYRWRDFLHFSLRILASNSPSTAYALNSIRGIVRRTGMYELARSRDDDKIVVFDEGTLSIVYRLFVYTDAHFEYGQLERFAELVPMPDKALYVKAPISSLIQRSTSRPDPRPQLSGKNTPHAASRIQRALDVFETLITTSPLRERVVIVNSANLAESNTKQLGHLRRLVHEWSSAQQSRGQPSAAAAAP